MLFCPTCFSFSTFSVVGYFHRHTTYQVESILINELRKLGVEVERGVEVLTFENREGEVKVIVVSMDATELSFLL